MNGINIEFALFRIHILKHIYDKSIGVCTIFCVIVYLFTLAFLLIIHVSVHKHGGMQ